MRNNMYGYVCKYYMYVCICIMDSFLIVYIYRHNYYSYSLLFARYYFEYYFNPDWFENNLPILFTTKIRNLLLQAHTCG